MVGTAYDLHHKIPYLTPPACKKLLPLTILKPRPNSISSAPWLFLRCCTSISFPYPLQAQEILEFLPGKIDPGKLHHSLEQLVDEGYIYRHGEFYSLKPEPHLVPRRLKGNEAAHRMMQKAHKFSRLIAAFPFVRCVCISGSLSKGFIDEQGDIDYFIITRPGRLWIARSLLIGFKKVFLLNSRKYFCVNYFIDTIT